MNRFFLTLLALLILASTAFAESWHGVYHFECRDSAGNIKWQETRRNALANEGQQEMLGVYLQGTTAPSAYAIGLTSMTFAKTTTYATITNEPSGNGYARQTINRDGTAAGWPTLALDVGDYQAISKAVTFTSTGTIGPVTSAFLVSATNNKLISYTALSTSRTLSTGDTLQITYKVKLQ
jgi:hypothetical protein